MVTPQDLVHRLKSQNYLLNEQYHVKVLLKRFHLNGNSIGFHPQTQSQNYILNKQCFVKIILKRIHMNGNTIGFHSQIEKLELHTTYIEPCQSTAEEVSSWSHYRISSIDSKATLKSTVLIRLINAAMLIKFTFALFKISP